jgi:hypothetical protein
MLADVREKLERAPFVPFIISTSDAQPAVLLGPIHINSIVAHESNGE